ncbi:MAG TPA: hypothetical protein VHY19_06475 [Steroidobacteraceae bacterium]|jgi:hypothetical protein|nr:hypothetical protein [Steroidobacteraceae bacterium]
MQSTGPEQIAERARLRDSLGVNEVVDTATAATLLGVKPQTMRRWACEGTGPIRPRRINGRLRWVLAEIRGLTA